MHHEMMDDESSSVSAMDARLIHVLESRPEMEIPAGFAARVVSRLPARRPASVTATQYGRNAMVMSMVALLVALLAWAPRTAGHSAVWLAVEWILCAEFASLVWWLGARRSDRR
ncbi:MAG: hypothetical protein ACR2JE_02140 [Acidobacteriaceae bacterium]